MKKLHIAAICLALICLFSGCEGLIANSYVSVNEHYDPYAYKEQTEPETDPTEQELPAVANYYEIMSLLRSFVTNGIEHGQFLMENYDGEIERELAEAFYAIKAEDPLGAYAIDYIEYEHARQGSGWLVTVDAVYRRSSSEIMSIRSVRGNELAMELIAETLEQLGSSVTLRISGYTEEDLAARIRRYCMEHPNTMVQTPEISLAVYPQSGNVRVVELHFTYKTDKETLREMQTEAESVLSSAERYVLYTPDAAEKISLLYSYLTSRFTYTEDTENVSVFRLLCEGVGNSESFASVTAFLCQRVGIPCVIVEGTRTDTVLPPVDEGEPQEPSEPSPYYWNIVTVDGLNYHVDFQRDALEGRSGCRLLLDSEMTGYAWDRDSTPICDGILPETETE